MPNDVLSRAIDAVCAGDHLTADHAAAVLAEIMEGRAGEVQTGAFLIALRAKGETADEIAGAAEAMREHVPRVHPKRDDLVDTAGTGGGRPTFNVSTTAALIAAGAGCAVAKHGNRSATGLSGSADLLEALGVRIDLGPRGVEACLEAVFGCGAVIRGARYDPGAQTRKLHCDLLHSRDVLPYQFRGVTAAAVELAGQ